MITEKMLLTNFKPNDLRLLITDCLKESLIGLDLCNSNRQETVKKILSRQETAEILGVSLPTLHSYTKEGLIKAFRLGFKVRYKYDDIIDALKQIKVGGKLCS